MKKVAIVGSLSSNYFGIGRNYHNFISTLDGTPIIITPEMKEDDYRELAKTVDLLILPGGADLSASLYGQSPSVYNTNPDVMKEHFFRNGLKYFVEEGTAIFGICLGFQMINVFFGGTLAQNVNVGIHQKDARFQEAHKVRHFTRKLQFGQETFPVNSHHHQAVKDNNLSSEMIPVTYSDEHDKHTTNTTKRTMIVESFIHKTLPIAGVQWHPEEWYDDHSFQLINELINRSIKAKNAKQKVQDRV